MAKGNQFWKDIPYEEICKEESNSVGKPRRFKKPSDLWEAVKCYFDECDKNPLISEEVSENEKYTNHKTIKHTIPYTWEGLYVYLGVSHLDYYKTLPEYLGIITHIGNIIRNQKLSGATAGIFNSNIIARELGLVDKRENDNNNKSVDPFDGMSTEELRELLNKMKED